jgi:hypothetical protein
MSVQSPADEAADLLIHYFRTIGGIDRADWDPDYSAEIRNLVDHLMDAARDIAREEIRAHQESEPHLYPDGSAS